MLIFVSALTLAFQITSAKVVAQQHSDEAKYASYSDFHRAAWGFGVLSGLLLILFSREITRYLHLENALLISYVAVGAMFYVPLGCRRGYVQGMHGFKRLATSLILEGVVRLVGSLIVLWCGYGVAGVVVANSLGVATAYLMIAPHPNPTGLVRGPVITRQAFKELTQALMFFTGQVVINNSDILIVKHYFASEQAGLYAAIALVGRVVFSLSSAVSNSMFPVIAASSEDDRKSQRLMLTSLMLVLGVGVLFSLGLGATPFWIWKKIFGVGFYVPGHHGFSYLLAMYAITTVIYSLSVVIILYEMAHKLAHSILLQLLYSGLLIGGMCRFHASLQQVILVQLVLVGSMFVIVGMPYLASAWRNGRAIEGPSTRTFTLVRRLTEDEVIAEFIKSDFEHSAYRIYHDSMRSVVMEPDLRNHDERALRRAILYLRHRCLWRELPLNTEWYVAELSEVDLWQIHVFPRAHWRTIAQGNFMIRNVVQHIRNMKSSGQQPFRQKISSIRKTIAQETSQAESSLGSVLLIGLDETRPLTILDGNHRMIAAIEMARFV